MATKPAQLRPARPHPKFNWKSRFNQVWVWGEIWVFSTGAGDAYTRTHPPRTRFLNFTLLNFKSYFH